MKGLFPEYENSTVVHYGEVWKNALFVFDTNVLLNLYRYRVATKDELLNVLTELAKQIWIPHHVALEFQRNRLAVIAEQSRRFAEVKTAVSKAKSALVNDLEKLQLQKRHSLINPDALIVGFETLAKDFLDELAGLEESQQTLMGPDPLKNRIEALFDGRVGEAPANQQDIDNLYKAAEARYKAKVPPGYEDGNKDQYGPDEHAYGGITYKRKYGDYLVWSQVLAHAAQTKTKALIYVTDDNKEDWWRKLDSSGPKTIGPRPELMEEATRLGGVDTFLMYNPEGFLKYAREALTARVSEETIEEVRDVSSMDRRPSPRLLAIRAREGRAHEAFAFWLTNRHPEAEPRSEFPDYEASEAGRRIGYELVVIPPTFSGLFMRLSDLRRPSCAALNDRTFDEIVWVLIAKNEAEARRAYEMLRHQRELQPDGVGVLIAALDNAETLESGFFPLEEIRF